MVKKILKKIFRKKVLLFIILGILAVLIFFVFFVFSKEESFISKKRADVGDETIIGLMQADTDQDGILDWEESLWGTDKNNPTTFDGMPDATYIEKQKEENNIKSFGDGSSTTETDKFAREFFSAYATLKTENVDNVSISSFASALGQGLINPELIDQYQPVDVIIDPADTESAKTAYYQTIKKYYEDALDVGAGNELDIVGNGMLHYNATGEESGFEELPVIASAYEEFAKKVMETPVPESIQDLHLLIANGANNTSIAVKNMKNILLDPVVGLSGLSQYQKYSEDLVNAVSDLETTLFY